MAGVKAFGTALSRSDMASSPTFTDVANIMSGPDGPSLSKDIIDVTAHDSPNEYREKLGGLRDGGQVTFDINWDPAETTHQPLITDFHDDDTPRDYMITYPDTSTVTFSAIVSGFEPGAPHDDKLTASVTMDVSGKPTFTAA